MSSVADIPDCYLPCRDLLHAWAPYNAAVRRKERVIVRTLRCTRCTTERDQFIDLDTGLLVGHARYRYPADYVVAGLGHLNQADRGTVRLRNIRGSKGR